MRTDNQPDNQFFMQKPMTTANVRNILLTSLVFAVLGAVEAFLILERSPSIYKIRIFYHQFVVHDLPGSLLSGVLLILAMVQLRWSLLPERVLDLIERYRWAVATVLAGLLAIGTLTIYHNYTLCMDEYAQLFQAKLFAAGKIWAEYPPGLLGRLLPQTWAFFTNSNITGHAIEGYWPGYSILQTPFVIFGVPWILNPLLGAGTLLLIRHIAFKLYPGTNAPSWAMLFTLASPVFIISCISYYSMPAQLFLNLLFTVLILKITPGRLLAAGLIGSLALIQKNPIPHFFYALPWIVWIAARRGGLRSLVCLAVGYLPLSLFLGFGWFVLRSYITAQTETMGNSFWELLKGLVYIFVANDFLLIAYYRILALFKLSAWAVPGLILFAMIGARQGWKDARIKVLTFSALLTFFGYFLFEATQGHGWGYRYFHGAWGTLPLLACGLVAVKRNGLPSQFTPLARVAGTLVVLSFVLLNGLRLYQVDAFIDRHLSQLPPLDPERKQVCFIRPEEGYYSIDLIQNDPFLNSKTIFVKSFGSEDEKQFIEKFYPDALPRNDSFDNRVWYIDGKQDYLLRHDNE